jgi:signal peptidase I
MKKRYFVIPLAFVFFILFVFLSQFRLVLVSGQSMEPTLHNNTLILLRKENEIPREHIVSVTAPKAWSYLEDKSLIKRVIAGPNDNLKIDSDFVYVNNKERVRIKGKVKIEQELDITLKENEYFVMGDNVGKSHDSLYEYSLGNNDYLVKRDLITYSTGDYPFEK